MKSSHLIFTSLIFAGMSSCQNPTGHSLAADTTENRPIHLVTLDPGHFHAALVQKSMYPDVDTNVYVYAPAGPDVKSYLGIISSYNTREKDPTQWNEHVYTGDHYVQQMIDDKKGNTVVLAGNNREKTSYIQQSLQAGFNVLADKPMVIDDQSFGLLRQSFDTAAARNLILYDIMTERYEITSILQRELAAMPAVYGTQVPGDTHLPGVVASSVHRWYKSVSGKALTRPAWFFDITQQGEGIVDVMTHLVDLVQWGCFPDQSLDYTTDVKVDNARHWSTDLTLSEFKTITGLDQFPDFLKKYADPKKDTALKIYANGEIDYRLRNVYVKASVTWTYDAPPGAGDTYSSLMRGSKANLVILQELNSLLPTNPLHRGPATRLHVPANAGHSIRHLAGKIPRYQPRTRGAPLESRHPRPIQGRPRSPFRPCHRKFSRFHQRTPNARMGGTQYDLKILHHNKRPRTRQKKSLIV